MQDATLIKKRKKQVEAVANGKASTGMMDGNGHLPQVDKKEKRPKKSKKLREMSQQEDGVAAAPTGTQAGSADSDAQQRRKKKKKQQKQMAAVDQATESAGVPANEDGPPQLAADDSNAATRKAAKRQRRAEAKAAARAQAAAVTGATAVNAPATDANVGTDSAADGARPSKKAKVAKTAAPQSAEMAAVGSRELAMLGRRIVKDLYTEHAAVMALSKEEVAKLRAARATVVEGSTLRPVLQFSQAGFSADLLHVTRDFAVPSPIQMETWPVACAGRDVIGVAATGSGKTLAFGLPALAHTQAQLAAGVAQAKAPSVLILSPTRELAMQIAAVMTEAGDRAGLATVCAYGGVPKHTQAAALRKGVHVIVATPGRLKDLMQDGAARLSGVTYMDLMQDGAARLSGVTYLVLDEADRMLDLGFEPDIRAIAGATRADRQTLMFSATWPTDIQRLASEFLSDPVKITIGSQDLSASHSVSQTVEVINPRDRDRRLEQLLNKYHSSRRNRVIVFVLYKKEAARVEAQLQRAGWKAAAVHGDASQAQRTRAVEQFKAGEVPLLIATDVAARGLDIPDVEFVINYSFPLTTEDYVHRIGRTGRAGKTGVAHTFFSGETDKARAGELINVLREAKQLVPPELLAFGTTVKKKESKLYGAHFKDVDLSRKATKVTFDSDDES